MPLQPEILNVLTRSSAEDTWRAIIKSVTAIASAPLATVNAASEVIKRDREIGAFDNFISASGWELWRSFGDSVERTSDRLARWWAEPYGGKAVLILDGLSLRELPWLLRGVQEHGLRLHELSVNASELPGATNEFARALGLGSRSQLQNNGGGRSHRLQPAQTESIDMPWKDCEGLVNGAPNWVFWHHWPDSKIHDVAGAGQGLDTLTADAMEQLNSADFWSFVSRLATGRRLVITSDHGYAATGYFPDSDGEVGQYLKKTFSSARSVAGIGESGPFVPPVALQLDSPHGPHFMALGRRKWKSPGGYPTLTHGGLSLLEVLSPFVEITK